MLGYEDLVYKALGKQIWLPSVHWFGMNGGGQVLIMDKLGANLDQLHRICRGKFSLKTVCMIAVRLVSLCLRIR